LQPTFKLPKAICSICDPTTYLCFHLHACLVSFLHTCVGMFFHVKHRSKETDGDDDSLMYFIDVNNEGVENSDQVLILASPINEIARQAWKVSQIRQFRITDLGVCIEFCPNCFRTHMPQYRSFNLFVRSSMINACVEFLCKKTMAVSLKESAESFITIYRLQNHKCPSTTPPNTPPPQVPPKSPSVRPPMPPRTHPRLGSLNAPPAEPYLPPYSKMRPSVGWDNLVCPYQITNKIVINNDGTFSSMSTVLGHSGSKTDFKSTRTPLRKSCYLNQHEQQKSHQQQRQQPVMKQQLHRFESASVPPRNIKRLGATSTVLAPSMDSIDNVDDEDYVNKWPTDIIKKSHEYDEMASLHHQKKPASYIEPISHTDDENDDERDYLNADQKMELISSIKPPEEPRTTSPEGTGCKDYVNVSDVISPDYMNIPDILQAVFTEEEIKKEYTPKHKAQTFPNAIPESLKIKQSPTPIKRHSNPSVAQRINQIEKSPVVSRQLQSEIPTNQTGRLLNPGSCKPTSPAINSPKVKASTLSRYQQSEVANNSASKSVSSSVVSQLVSQLQGSDKSPKTQVKHTPKAMHSEVKLEKASIPPVSAKPQAATTKPLPSSQGQGASKTLDQNTVAADGKSAVDTTTQGQLSHHTAQTVPQSQSPSSLPKVSTKPVSRLKDHKDSSSSSLKIGSPPRVATKPGKSSQQKTQAEEINQTTTVNESKAVTTTPVNQHIKTKTGQITGSAKLTTGASSVVKQIASQLNTGPIKPKQSPKAPVRRSSLSNEGSPAPSELSKHQSLIKKRANTITINLEQPMTSSTTQSGRSAFKPVRKAPLPPVKPSSGSKL